MFRRRRPASWLVRASCLIDGNRTLHSSPARRDHTGTCRATVLTQYMHRFPRPMSPKRVSGSMLASMGSAFAHVRLNQSESTWIAGSTISAKMDPDQRPVRTLAGRTTCRSTVHRTCALAGTRGLRGGSRNSRQPLQRPLNLPLMPLQVETEEVDALSCVERSRQEMGKTASSTSTPSIAAPSCSNIP